MADDTWWVWAQLTSAGGQREDESGSSSALLLRYRRRSSSRTSFELSGVVSPLVGPSALGARRLNSIPPSGGNLFFLSVTSSSFE